MSTISASTTSTTAYKVTADTTGKLVLQTGSTPTTAVTIGTDQKVGFNVTSPTSMVDVYYASSVIGSGAIGYTGNFQGGSGTVSYTGSSIRGTGVLINSNQNNNITVPWGGNYEMQGLLSAARATNGGNYGVHAVAGYGVSDGFGVGGRFGADGSPNTAGSGYGVYINNVAGGGSTGLAVGLYIGTSLSAATTYGIASDYTGPSYHLGQLRIGSTSNTTVSGWTPTLQVAGAANIGRPSQGVATSTATTGGAILRQTGWAGPSSTLTIPYDALGVIDNSGGTLMVTATNKVGGANGGVGTILIIWTKHSGGNLACTTVSSQVAGTTTTMSAAASGGDIVITSNSGSYFAWTSISAG